MGIKPALGWLALLLFTTTAQAEGTREIFKVGPRGRPSASSPMVASPPPPVTPKTKVGPIGEGKAPLPAAAPAIPAIAMAPARVWPTVIATTGTPSLDYEAETRAGGGRVDTPRVRMVFEHEARDAFRVDKRRIRRIVRLAEVAGAREHVDVLDTEDGAILVDTKNRGSATASDVYVFPRGATLDERVRPLDEAAGASSERLRAAMVAAQWAPSATR